MIILSDKCDTTGHVGLQSVFKKNPCVSCIIIQAYIHLLTCNALGFCLKTVLQVTVGVKKVFAENLVKMHISNMDVKISKARKTQGKLVC